MIRIQDKYHANKPCDLVVDKYIVQQVNTFLDNFSKPNSKSNLVIQGETGVGKSTLIKILLKDKGFQIKIPKPVEITKKRTRTKKDNSKKKKENDIILDYYNSLCNNVDDQYINHFFNIDESKKINKPIAFLLDNEDSYLINGDPNYIRILARTNDKYRRVPFIMVIDNSHKKIIGHIKNIIIKIDINYPNNYLLNGLVNKICIQEKIQLNNSYIINKLIEASLGDIRKLMNFLDDLKIIYHSKVITMEIINQYLNSIQATNKQKSIFDKNKLLFTEYLGIEETFRQYISDKTIIPLMLDFNYLPHITKQAGHLNYNQKLKLMNKISSSMAFGESIDSYIFSGQVWDIQNLHCISTCTYPSYLISSIPNKKNYKEKFPFAIDLHKMGVKMTNRKMFTQAQKMNIYDINIEDDLLNMIRILKKLVEQKNYNQIGYLVHKYHITHKLFGKLFKIDGEQTEKSKTKELSILKSYFPKEIKTNSGDDD